jgi:hypothetical protein
MNHYEMIQELARQRELQQAAKQKKNATGVATTKPVPGVAIVEEARAQIARDLSTFIPQKEQIHE